MEYAHDHESELLAALDDRTEEVIRELEARERQAQQELRRKPPRGAYADLPPF